MIVGSALMTGISSVRGKPLKNYSRLLSVALLLSVSLGTSSVCRAAEVLTLTLDQALAIAQDKNWDIAKAKEYGQQVQGRYVEERAAALPQFNLAANIYADKDDSLGALGLPSAVQYHQGVDLQLTQVLFNWGKVMAAIRAAQVGLKTADQQLRQARQATYRDVAIAFYDVLLAKELHRIAGQNLEQKTRHLDEAQRKFDAGVATDYDVLAGRVEVENARPAVIRTDNQIRVARERLRFLLGSVQQEVDAIGSLETDVAPPPTYEEALRTASRQRPELLDRRYRIGIADELVTIASAENKPRLDLKGGVGWRNLDVNNVQQDGAAWTVGVFLNFPFFDGFRTSGKVQQARSDLQTQRIEEAKLLDGIALQVRNAGNDVAESAAIVQALSGTVEQAGRLLAMAEKGYEYGVKIRLEVDDAQFNLNQAQGNLARARRDYLSARVGLLWTMGVLGEGEPKP